MVEMCREREKSPQTVQALVPLETIRKRPVEWKEEETAQRKEKVMIVKSLPPPQKTIIAKDDPSLAVPCD